MQITKTITITTTVGVLTVTVTPSPSRGYPTTGFRFTVDATPRPVPATPGAPCARVDIDYGDGITDTVMMTSSPPWYFPPAGASKYYTAGTYTVKFTVLDVNTNATGSGSTSVEVRAALNAVFTADKTAGVAPLTVAFSFSMSGGYTPYTWTLDFGNGSAVLSNPTSPQSHTYAVGGKTYAAKLIVTDALGAAASFSITFSVFGVEAVVPPEVWALVETLGMVAPIATVLGVIVGCELKKAGILA